MPATTEAASPSSWAGRRAASLTSSFEVPQATRLSSGMRRCSTTVHRCPRGFGWLTRPSGWRSTGPQPPAVARALGLAIDRLESAGGVRQAEAAVGRDELEAAHRRYAAERDQAIPAGW